MIKFLGLDHAFFRPMIRRVLTVLAIALYGVFELFFGHPGWSIFALCLGVICVYAFFVKFDPKEQGSNDV